MALRDFGEFAKLLENLKDEKFTMLLCPCNQFLKQEPDPPEAVENYMSKVLGLADGGSYIIADKVKVNRERSHVLYKYLKRYSMLFDENWEQARPIPWNFSKFLVSVNGRVTDFKGPTCPPLEMERYIRQMLPPK